MSTTYKKRTTTKKKSGKVKDVRGSYSAKSAGKTQVIEALYDGKVFLPKHSPMLKANTRVRITVETVKTKRTKKKSFLETARSIKIEAPSDFSSNIDAYLYGGKSFNE